MADIVDPATRSRMMAGIRGKNTRPEVSLRKSLFARGLRYRLHDRRLPGRPDVVFPKYRAALFVNGCFWHGHECDLFRWPGSNETFWRQKITSNQDRDVRKRDAILAAGWRLCVVWECALRGSERRSLEDVADVISAWLGSGSRELVLASASAGCLT